MKAKVVKPRSTTPKLNVKGKRKMKQPAKTIKTLNKNLTSPKRKYSKQQSPNKLSTLDTWLRTLYQSKSTAENNNVTSVVPTSETTNTTEENVLKAPAKKRKLGSFRTKKTNDALDKSIEGPAGFEVDNVTPVDPITETNEGDDTLVKVLESQAENIVAVDPTTETDKAENAIKKAIESQAENVIPVDPSTETYKGDDPIKKVIESRTENITSVDPKSETTKANEKNTIERPAKLCIRLEKIDLLELKNSINSKAKGSRVKRCKKKFAGPCYKDRSSEYIRLASNKFKCAKCSFMHCNLVAVRTHYDKEHSDKIYSCILCPFRTTQQYYFNSHVRFHSTPDQECPYCKKMIKAFSYKMHLKTHKRNETEEYKCSFCDYRSYNHANVKRHMVTLHKDPCDLQNFSCDSCSYVTILEERLRQHKKIVHSKEGVWLTCTECDYTTRNKSHMRRHVNDVHREKSVECGECTQLFSSRSNLRYHVLRMHRDESSKKFYYCEMCPKEEQYKTTEKGNLARHILAHRTLDEIEVFACHKCPYLGKSKNALKTHFINAHLPEMHEYRCRICGYSTSTKSRYNNHIKDVHGKPTASKFKRKIVKNIMNKTDDEAYGDLESNLDTDLEVKIEITDLTNERESSDVANLNTSGQMKQLTLADFWATHDQRR